MEYENQKIKAPQILIKPEWANMLEFLTAKEAATVFKNIFRYYHDEPLEKMSPIAAMFFSRIEEVMDYNNHKYQSTVERNRKNGIKSKGRPVKNEPEKTQENPVGYFGYPENPKEKEKEKEKTKEKPREKDIATDKSKAALNEAQLEKLEQQLMQLANQNWSHIQDKEEANFIYSCQLLAEELSWERFTYLMLQASKEEVEQSIILFNISLPAAEILELRKHSIYYLNKLIPQLP